MTKGFHQRISAEVYSTRQPAMRSFLLICLTLLLANAFQSGQALLAADEAKPKPLSVTFTYGHNGVIRTDDRFLAGEGIFATVVALRYEVPANGICQCTMRYSLIDQDGKVSFSNADDKVIIELEGEANLAKVMVQCQLPDSLNAGKFDFVLELRDKKTKEVFRSSQPITILPKDEFALGDFCFCADSKASIPLGTTFDTCQLLYCCLRVYHPTARNDTWQLEIEMDILDANHKSISPQKSTPRRKDFPALTEDFFNTNISLAVEEPGEYTLALKITDLVSGKTETRSIPFRVVPSLSDILPAPAQ